MQWQLDDWLYYMALPSLRPGIALRDPKEVVNIWADEAQALKAEGGVFNLTLHPFCSGRTARAQGIDDLIGRLMDSDEVWSRQEPSWPSMSRANPCNRSSIGPSHSMKAVRPGRMVERARSINRKEHLRHIKKTALGGIYYNVARQ